MKRLIFAVVMALIVFGLLNFVYCNLDDKTFSYPIVFKFSVPLIMPNGFQTIPLPLGFILLSIFCFGMVFIALLETLPSVYKSLELRSRNKRIKELERELKVVKEMSGVEKQT